MMKVKGVPFSQVKQKLLNTPEAVKGYEDADKELEMVEMLYEMREKAGLIDKLSGVVLILLAIRVVYTL